MNDKLMFLIGMVIGVIIFLPLLVIKITKVGFVPVRNEIVAAYKNAAIK